MAPTSRAYELVAILAEESSHDDAATPEERAAALEALNELGTDAISALIDGLATTNIAYIQRAFVSLGEPAVLPLIAVLNQEEAEALSRANAALILGKLGDARAQDALIAALDDDSPLIRREAAQALSAFKASEMVLPLCALLLDDEPEVRSRAALTLGVQGDVRAVEPLNDTFLRDEDDRVRRAAHDAMKRIGERAAQETVQDIDLFRAAKAVERMQHPHEKLDTDEIRQRTDPAEPEKLFHTLGVPRVELLLATLESDDHNVQRRAVRELIRMGDKVVPALIAAIDQADKPTARAHIAFALGEMKNAKALPALHQLLASDIEDVHYAARNAISKIEGAADIPPE